MLLIASCNEPVRAPEPAVLVLGGDSIFLPIGARIHDIAIRQQSSNGEFAPDTIQAHVGDVIRFTAVDAGSHALSLDSSSNTDLVRTFLEETGQRRSPPLLQPGATWIVYLKDAPTGNYLVYCLTHSDSAHIVVTLDR